MKNKSIFTQIILLIIVGVLCVTLTVVIALLAGAANTNLFDFSNINFANMIPVLLIGIFITCFIIGICILFIGKSAFTKMYDHFKENNKTNGGNEK